jgi:hypothetical protein
MLEKENGQPWIWYTVHTSLPGNGTGNCLQASNNFKKGLSVTAWLLMLVDDGQPAGQLVSNEPIHRADYDD